MSDLTHLCDRIPPLPTLSDGRFLRMLVTSDAAAMHRADPDGPNQIETDDHGEGVGHLRMAFRTLSPLASLASLTALASFWLLTSSLRSHFCLVGGRFVSQLDISAIDAFMIPPYPSSPLPETRQARILLFFRVGSGAISGRFRGWKGR